MNEIQENYSQIINQVMTETIQDIKDVAQDSFKTIHQLQIMGKEYCRTSIDDFTQTLDSKLKQAKFQLITASATLIKDNTHIIINDPSNSSELISQKLDALLSPETLSKDIVQSSMNQEHFEFIKYLIHGNKYYLMNRHEKNEAAALYAWIHSWLTDVKYSLKREFDLYLHESGVMA
ncbi:hypothetical protein K501DRAFT_283349 [Backusella circina FSU 941]|nr:hypothetical protein K501DRAFT_283349 [Backusella circina FSU 941]